MYWRNSDLSEITKYVSSSKTDQLELNIKDTQLHNILRQIYQHFSDRYNYVVKICGGVGEKSTRDTFRMWMKNRKDKLDLARFNEINHFIQQIGDKTYVNQDIFQKKGIELK